ncbi:MAG: hypothetical protein UY23_C0005G0042 [Candidatus Jorgensenbacteria bacterium GW2011_GWA1_48_11]|uniref:LmbE family protein n=1 Tax=Candidatus Jorgensenbacteria bacterium GW2011_GWA1_48_11 TaxID=1618660 RepID=A0A0G1U9U7_9BACT|nr:MAG: hypothetical protein UT62_C0024G0009 [Parcubacteria group bacterium GW2011_GWC1_39_8]KKU90946.1 MAG: hypothetical protein UY23_C0005G0042 [Candidatus Jorgensenbacteria bacterium GW2011_GWA1_48_11]KKW12323.1 MAG: hypothetical protein UY51_C0005G0565 [Candidatus Jorgensenbacteria bacterium GW2011_GWB1_49_9]
MLKGTLFVQPHSDDMVMSSYFLIKTQTLPKPYYLLTIFSKSSWLDPIRRKRFCLANSERSVTRLRIAEDKEFARLLRLVPYFFGFKDCLLRNGKTHFHSKTGIERDLVNKISNSLTVFIKKHNIQNMVIPFESGARQHQDHRIVHRAAELIKLPIRIYFVDDIPYSRVPDSKKYNLAIFKRVKIKNIQEKFRAMDLYKSQMCDLFFNQVQKITERNQGYERIFVLKKDKK